MRAPRGVRVQVLVDLAPARPQPGTLIAVGSVRSDPPEPVTGADGGVRVRLQDARAAAADLTVLRHGGLALDLRTRRIAVDGRETDLSAREFALAEEFLRHPEQVLSREQLLSRVWGMDFDPGSNVVDVYVRYLRRKIGPDRLETVRGMGYRLTVRP